MRSVSELNGATHIIETVSGRNCVVLIGLQNVAVHAALERSRAGEAFAVKRDARVGAHGLQIEPIIAGVRRSERTFPSECRVGRKRVAPLDREVKFVIGFGIAASGALESRLPIVAQSAGGYGGAGHVIVDSEADVGVAR